MEEFVEAVKAEQAETDEDAPTIEVEWQGEKIRAYQPEESQVVFLMATMGRGRKGSNKFADMVNLLLETLDDESNEYVSSRMLQRSPKLPVDAIEDLFSKLSEQWFARPTQKPSGSAG